MGRIPKPLKPLKIVIPNVDDIGVQYGITLRAEKLIGRFVVAWSRVEAIMGDVIWVILDVNMEDGRVITSRMGADQKLGWLRTFAEKHTPDEFIESLAKAITLAELILTERNFIVHGSWGRLKTGELLVASLRPKTDDPNKVVTAFFDEDRLEQLVDMADTVRDTFAMWRQLHETLPGRRTPPLYSTVPRPHLSPVA